MNNINEMSSKYFSITKQEIKICNAILGLTNELINTKEYSNYKKDFINKVWHNQRQELNNGKLYFNLLEYIVQCYNFLVKIERSNDEFKEQIDKLNNIQEEYLNSSEGYRESKLRKR